MTEELFRARLEAEQQAKEEQVLSPDFNTKLDTLVYRSSWHAKNDPVSQLIGHLVVLRLLRALYRLPFTQNPLLAAGTPWSVGPLADGSTG